MIASITNKTQKINLNTDIRNLLCDIDIKISKVAKRKLDNTRYGVQEKNPRIFDNIQKLIRYKYILLQKMNTSHYIEFNIEDIIARIKNLININ